MAKAGGGTVGGPGLRFVLLLAAAALITAAVGALSLLLFASPRRERPAAGVLQRGFSAHTTFQQERLQRLELAARLLAADPALAAGLVARGGQRVQGVEGGVTPELLSTLLRQRLPRVGADLALLLDASGALAARSDSALASPPARPPLGPAAAGAADGGETLTGVWEDDGNLYYAARAPVTPDFTLAGWVVVALAVDDVLALEVERAGGADAAFYAATEVGPRLVGASDRALAGQVDAQVGGLGGPDGELARVLAGSGPVPNVPVDAGGRPHQALVAPLTGSAGDPVGAIVLTAPARDEAAGPNPALALAGLATGVLLALLLTVPAALALGRSSGAAAGRLTAAVDAARAGELPQRTAGAGGPLGGLARALDRLLGDLHERQALAAVAAAAARGGTGAAKTAQAAEAEEERAVLLAADLRRYAAVAGGTGAGETFDRLRRDLRAFAAAVSAGDGRFEGALGHRALASFAGEGGAARALGAAARALVALAARDNAFDEGAPPALALAGGRVTAGRVEAGGGEAGGGGRRIAVGTPLGLLDSLLREAQAGELAIAPPLVREIEGELARAGVSAKERPGMLSPRPVTVLDTAAAERLAGAPAAGSAAGSTTGSTTGRRDPDATRHETTRHETTARRLGQTAAADRDEGHGDPAALGPGDALGERFEVLAVERSGPEGATLRARDRELGEVVAVEALAPAAVARPEVFARLDSPLQSVRKLAHPGIARTYDYGRAGGVPFLACEHVPGTRLDRLLETPGRLPPPAALGLGRQLAAALASAHRDGIAHGRLAPERLVLGADGRLKVTGFGLAGVLAAAPGPPRSPGPQPPEGAGGPRGDVYAAAAILHRLLLGAWPEPGAQPAAEGLPEGLAPVLAAALAPEPAKRPEDGAALAAALDGVRA